MKCLQKKHTDTLSFAKKIQSMEGFVSAIFERQGAVCVDPHIHLRKDGIDYPMIRWSVQVPENVNEREFIALAIESEQKQVQYFSFVAYNTELRLFMCYVLY